MKKAPVLTAAVAVLVVALGGCSSQGEAPAAPATAPTQVASRTPLDDEPADAHVLESPAPAMPTRDGRSDQQALSRATAFVRAWARPQLPAEEWWAGVRGFIAPGAKTGFQYTDPAFIPVTAVTGAAQFAEEPSGTAAVVNVPTDAGDHLVTVIRGSADQAWLVASIAPAED